MTTTAPEDMSRVTVISPTRRVDIALPASTSLGECLPTILQYSGYETTTAGEAVHTWVLQRLGEDPLDPGKRVSALEIRDGETLYLRQRDNAMPDAAFDDVVDAVTTATTVRPSWDPNQSQWLAVITMAVVLVGIPALLLFTADIKVPFGGLLEAGIALFLSGAALVGAIVTSRALGKFLPAAGLSWSAILLAGLGGFFLGAQQSMPLRALLAAAAVLLVAGISWLAARVQPYAHLAVVLTAAVTMISTMVMVLLQGQVAQVAAVTAAIALGLTSAMPKLAFRAAQVAMPNLPATAAALMADDQPIQADIVQRAITADKALGSFLAATGFTVTMMMLPVLRDSGWIGLALGAAVSIALMLRARAFVGRVQRLSLLLAGLVVGLLTTAGFLMALPEIPRVLVGAGLVLVVTLSLAGYASSMYNRILSPVWGRFGDVLEWLAIIAIVPLVLGVLHVYEYVVTLASGR